MKYSSIAISGQVSTGKSTAAKNVAKKLSLEHHSVGDFFRKYALEHNIPLHDKEQIPDELDRKIDEKLKNLAEIGSVVIDGDYIGYFTKDLHSVLKVLLTCEYKTRIKRALVRVHTHQETEEEIRLREEGLDKKFRRLYANEYFQDPKFFDLVIDNTNLSPEEVAEKIVKAFKQN